MIRRLFSFLMFLNSTLLCAQTLLVKNIQVIEVEQEQVLTQDLYIQDGFVQSLANLPRDYSGPILDGTGKWLVPGYVDTHVHAVANILPNGGFQNLGLARASDSLLYAGVTSYLDLFHEENEIFQLRNRQRQNLLGPEQTYPDIFAAGPIFTCSGGHGTEYETFTRTIDTPEQAELEISALAYKKPDVIKLVYDHNYRDLPTMSHLTLERAVKTAQRFQIPVVVHIGTWADAEEAIDLGAAAITHTHFEELPASLVQKMIEKKIAFIPTLTVQSDLAEFVENPQPLRESKLFQTMHPAAFLDFFTQLENFDRRGKAFLNYQRRTRSRALENVRQLISQGVRVLTGTDTGNVGVFQGYSIHREMKLLTHVGATPWQALRAATLDAAQFLGQKYGVAPGSLANFVVLNDSPLAAIENTESISQVILHGRLVDRKALLHSIREAPCWNCFSTVALPRN